MLTCRCRTISLVSDETSKRHACCSCTIYTFVHLPACLYESLSRANYTIPSTTSSLSPHHPSSLSSSCLDSHVGVLDSAHTTHKSTEREKDGLEKQLADALLASHEAMNALQSVLVVMGVSTAASLLIDRERMQTQQLHQQYHHLHPHYHHQHRHYHHHHPRYLSSSSYIDDVIRSSSSSSISSSSLSSPSHSIFYHQSSSSPSYLLSASSSK